MRCLAASLTTFLSAWSAEACDVALALTVDVSGSISPQEYDLQMNGLARALDDTSVADALVSAQAQVAVILWSGASRQEISIEWRQMNSLDDIENLSAQVRQIERPWRHFSTAIGEMLAITGPLFDQVACKRNVIDVSGDGISNEGEIPDQVRDRLVANGIHINALAILGASDEDLVQYYTSHVIGGENAFVYSAQDYEDYPRAIRRKLLDEITEPVS